MAKKGQPCNVLYISISIMKNATVCSLGKWHLDGICICGPGNWTFFVTSLFLSFWQGSIALSLFLSLSQHGEMSQWWVPSLEEVPASLPGPICVAATCPHAWAYSSVMCQGTSLLYSCGVLPHHSNAGYRCQGTSNSPSTAVFFPSQVHGTFLLCVFLPSNAGYRHHSTSLSLFCSYVNIFILPQN